MCGTQLMTSVVYCFVLNMVGKSGPGKLEMIMVVIQLVPQTSVNQLGTASKSGTVTKFVSRIGDFFRLFADLFAATNRFLGHGSCTGISNTPRVLK